MLRRYRVWEVQVGPEGKYPQEGGVAMGWGTTKLEHLPPLGFQDLSRRSHGCPGSPSSSRRSKNTCWGPFQPTRA